MVREKEDNREDKVVKVAKVSRKVVKNLRVTRDD